MKAADFTRQGQTKRQMEKHPHHLNALLRRLAKDHPRTAEQLSRAHSNRELRLSQYLGGARLKGYEELISNLEALESVYRKARKLRDIAFLIRRAKGDFETALEAALSGFHAVAHDAMRDVMEIEFLLRDFIFEPSHIDQWLSCTPKERHDRFRPAILRQRHAQRLGKAPQDLGEATDYKAHSQSLHVTPRASPFGGPGLAGATLPFAEDSCFWEIFEHGRRLLFAVHYLRRKLARHVPSPRGPERGLPRVRDAWRRTQEMQSMYVALLKAAREKSQRGA